MKLYLILIVLCFTTVKGFNASLYSRNVGRDRARLTIRGTDLILNAVSDNCFKCDSQSIGSDYGTYYTAVLATTFAWSIAVYKNDGHQDIFACSGEYLFKEHGEYELTVVADNKTYLCTEMMLVNTPINTYTPLLILFLALLALVIVYNILCCMYRRRMMYVINQRNRSEYTPITGDAMTEGEVEIPDSSQHTRNVAATSPPPQHRGSTRVTSVDTFRGISITLMIFVNYGGGKYWFFNHSKWNGLTVADLVFPWFIFIMGSSIHISCRSMFRKQLTKRVISRKILLRSLKLLALGLFLNNGFDLEHWRIPGVLQRFAISYFFVALTNVWLNPTDEDLDIHFYYDWRDMLRDLIWFPWHHLIMTVILVLYLLVIFLMNAPGCPKGYFGPGGISDHGMYVNCTGGVSGYIDRMVFGETHIYQHPTCKPVYQCLAYDPEGLLGVLPSILLTYFGLQAARILHLYPTHIGRIVRWIWWALCLGILALILCGNSKDEGTIPVNKNLWSLSFVFATGATAFFILAICYTLVDTFKVWSGAPFYFSGMNAIVLYCGHELLEDYFPFNFKTDGSHLQLTASATIGTSVWLVIAYVMYRNKIFLRL